MNQRQAVLDRLLTEDINYFLSREQDFISRDSVSVDVRGGVAHVSGRVTSRAEQVLLRQTISRVKGIHAVWDVLSTAQAGEPCVVDIGCGNVKQKQEAIGLDRHSHRSVDVLADIERGLPLTSDSVDRLYAIHFLEHVRELLVVMNEIHRVLKPDGVLHVMVPNWSCVNAVADPTHVRYFHLTTFKFFCRAYPGLQTFRPLCVSSTSDDLFADLQPIKDGSVNSDESLCRFF